MFSLPKAKAMDPGVAVTEMAAASAALAMEQAATAGAIAGEKILSLYLSLVQPNKFAFRTELQVHWWDG